MKGWLAEFFMWWTCCFFLFNSSAFGAFASCFCDWWSFNAASFVWSKGFLLWSTSAKKASSPGAPTNIVYPAALLSFCFFRFDPFLAWSLAASIFLSSLGATNSISGSGWLSGLAFNSRVPYDWIETNDYWFFDAYWLLLWSVCLSAVYGWVFVYSIDSWASEITDCWLSGFINISLMFCFRELYISLFVLRFEECCS